MSTLSVIIPTLNEERHIGALLCDVASQTRRPDEVLIVDAGSADGTIAETRRFPFARRAVPLQGAYCAAKHGVDSLLDTLRVELRREGWPIGVTNVMPAAINTPFFDKARTSLGVKPEGFPPPYAPGVVADAIQYAAEKAQREIVAGGAGKGMILGKRLSPRLMDTVMPRGGFGSQMTDEPKSADDPDALFEPVQDRDCTDGDFGSQTLGRSLVTWLDTHPKLKGAAIAGTALGAAVLLRARS